MSELERAFITTAESTWKKVEDKNGRIRHFKDGIPKTQQAFNSATQHVKYEGESVNVAVPSEKKGVEYERIEVSPIEASALGQELNFMRSDVPGQPRESVTLGGEEYETRVLQDLNERIADRYGADAVMKY